MAAFLNFRGACTYNLKNTKTIGDKLNLINDITSQYMYECNQLMVSHQGHNCISSALTILDSALTS